MNELPSFEDAPRPSSRILFFSSEPGGAEVLIPAIQLLQSTTDYEVIVAGYGHGLHRFKAKKIDCKEIGRIEEGDLALLKQIAPDLLITSATSLPAFDMSDRHLWLGARSLGVPSVAFLDQWQNYAARFSGADAKSRMLYQPDFINCINEVGEQEMLAEGFEKSRLMKFGHPYLSTLRTGYNNIIREEVASRIGLDFQEKVVVFASESIREHFGKSRGYDQHDALDMFFRILNTSSGALRPVLKLHPKDNPEEYSQYIKRYKANLTIMVTDELNSIECISLADYVFGMSSIMLVEAWCLGKPVISLQPNLQVQDPFVLSRMGIVTALTGISKVNFNDLPFDSVTPRQSFSVAFQEEEFLRFIRDLLGRH